ncbi:MAG TPA: alkaline phosphatase family protein, partial [Thermomicrobiales bacterium]|nr:alkaline phosphatase family protein [Thermomicrobiales bacterium]
MWRPIHWILATALCQAMILVVLAWVLPDVTLRSVQAVLLAAAIVTAFTVACWPLAYRLAARFSLLLFPLASVVLMVAVVNVTDDLVDLVVDDGFTLDSIWSSLVLAAGLTAANTILGAVFALNDARAYERFVVRPLRRRYRDTPTSAHPGILFLVIDGLAEPILRQAMAAGYAPTLKRWVEDGSHTLRSWETDLSSQTAACQAGILLGSNEGIPAFRWWDKQHGRLMVVKERATAELLEATLSTGNGLLARGGGARFTIFSGDTTDCIATLSRIGTARGRGQLAYLLYFINPYTLFRTIGLFIADVVRERWEARAQRRHDIRPRIHRPFCYAFARAGPTVILQEAARFMAIADMLRGMPTSYVTFYAYDTVAHHSGIDRIDAFKVLQKLDRIIGSLEQVAREAPRPYRFVVLSDHGQSMGATFEQRYGQTLGDVVDELLADELRVSSPVTEDESIDELDTALEDAIALGSRPARWMARVLLSRLMGDSHAASAADQAAQVAESDVVVLASGNLGLISFTRAEQRLTYEQIESMFPGFLTSLVQHPGVGFVMTRSTAKGGLVLGDGGVHYLDRGHASGRDPLAGFGPNAAAHLRRADQFLNAPDILVMSLLDEASGGVAAFEELVGC